MEKITNAFKDIWNRYKDWLGDKTWYKNWKVWLSILVVLGIAGMGTDSTADSTEPDVDEPEIEEVAEAEEEPEEIEEVAEEPAEEEVEEVVEEEPEPEPEPDPEPEVFDPEDYNKELTFDDLARNPDENFFKKVTFEGKIIQVIQGDGASQFRIATNDDYDKVMLIEIDNSMLGTRILEDDYIRFYGTYMGEMTYESTLGGNITVPAVLVDEFEFQ